MTQERNKEVLFELLEGHQNENMLVGTHGTALSTILHFFDHTYSCTEFLRMIDYMPYIIRLDFEEKTCVGKEELLIVEKEFQGKVRADKS